MNCATSIFDSTTSQMQTISHHVRNGEFKQAGFWLFGSLLHLLQTRRWKEEYNLNGTFSRSKELPYWQSITLSEACNTVQEAFYEIVPRDLAMATRATSLLNELGSASGANAILNVVESMHTFYVEVHNLVAPNQSEFFSSNSESLLHLSIDDQDNGFNVTWAGSIGDTLALALQEQIRTSRYENRLPTFKEFIIEHIVYQSLANGKGIESLNFSNQAQFLGTVGFRSISQTYPSLTDPGDGHILGTTRKSQYLNGVIVHVEHLERPGGVSRKFIESYRIPAILDFARVRLHTAGAMPTTYFIGRALRDASGSFEQSFIKIVNTASAACSQAFMLGAAECKISMDGLTTSEMIAYMKSLNGHTIRKPHQYLSCAFNLNWPIVDDVQKDNQGQSLPAQVLSNPFIIASKAIDLCLNGGFEKVTWDGASDKYPSKCIIHQLSFEEWISLVHKAHESGLTTYASAGFKFAQIRFAVWAGFDGIGVGGAQILRHMDGETGMHGPYTEENIDRILQERNDAASHLFGRAAALLARLDRMYFEGTLTAREDELRLNLFNSMIERNEHQIEAMLANPLLKQITNIEDDGQRPYTAWAQRMLRQNSKNEAVIARRFVKFSSDWKELSSQLLHALCECGPKKGETSVDAKNASMNIEENIFDIFHDKIWTALRTQRIKNRSQALSQHDSTLRMKTTPFSRGRANKNKDEEKVTLSANDTSLGEISTATIAENSVLVEANASSTLVTDSPQSTIGKKSLVSAQLVRARASTFGERPSFALPPSMTTPKKARFAIQSSTTTPVPAIK